MIVAFLAAMRVADRRGYRLVLVIPFMALPIRVLVAAWLTTGWGVRPVQAPAQALAAPGSGTAPVAA